MVDEDDYHLSSAELTLRVEPRFRELLNRAGVPPEEIDRVLAAALRYLRLRSPPGREIERRFLFAVERECRRFQDELRERVMREIETMKTEREEER